MQEASQGSVEMYIASADLPLPLQLQTMSVSEDTQKLFVAPPRNQRAMIQQDSDESAPAVQHLMPTDASRALRKELGVTRAELQSKSALLGQAERMLKCEFLRFLPACVIMHAIAESLQSVLT